MSVEIYSRGREGTIENPIVANQRAMFSAVINGVDAEKANASYEWRSSPQLHPYGSDIHKVSFGIPDWNVNGILTVRLKLTGHPMAGSYSRDFHVRPMTEEERANRVIPTRSIYISGEEHKFDVAVFEEAERLGYLKREGFWFPKWHYKGPLDEFMVLMGLDRPDPPLPEPEPEPDKEPDTEWLLSRIDEIEEILGELREGVKDM